MIFKDGKVWENTIKLINKINAKHRKINLKVNQNLGLMTGSDFLKLTQEKNFIFQAKETINSFRLILF